MPLSVAPIVEYLMQDGPAAPSVTSPDGNVIPAGSVLHDNSGNGHTGTVGIRNFDNYAFKPDWIAGTPSPGLRFANLSGDQYNQFNVPDSAYNATYSAGGGPMTVHMVLGVRLTLPSAALRSPNHQGLCAYPQMQLDGPDSQLGVGQTGGVEDGGMPKGPMLGVNLVTVVFNGVNNKFYLNGAPFPGYGIAAPLGSRNLTPGAPGGNGWVWGSNGATSYMGDWHYLAIFGAALSPSQVAADFTHISGLMSAKGVTVANQADFSKPGLVPIGDSILMGSTAGNAHNFYATKIRYALDPYGTGEVLMSISGKGGRPTTEYGGLDGTLTPLWTDGVLPLLDQFTGEKAVLDMLGANDFGLGYTSGQVQTMRAALSASARAHGAKYIISSTLPSTALSEANEAKRAAWNSWFESNWQTIADEFAPVHLDPTIGRILNGLNPSTNGTYYAGDHVHLIDVGQAQMAANLLPAIRRGLKLPTYAPSSGGGVSQILGGGLIL